MNVEYTNRGSRLKPSCPFCGLYIARPNEIHLHRPLEMPVGSCSCGAVYAYDATGHNLGAAFSEALVFACNMDWDLAWSLLPPEDYLEDLVEHYDVESNYVIPCGINEGRRICGALYFVKMQKEIQKVTGQGVQTKVSQAKPTDTACQISARLTETKTIAKKEIEALVANYQLKPLLKMASNDLGIILYLQRLLYSGDELLRLKTADALGQACAVIAQHEPAAVANLLQRLVASITNTGYGTSSWGAVDAIGEVIAKLPDMFGGYLPFLFQTLEEDENLRPTVLRALGNVARQRPDLITKSLNYFIKFVRMDELQTRGYAVWLVTHLTLTNERLGIVEAKAELNNNTGDHRPIHIYANGVLEQTSIGQLATRALGNINGLLAGKTR